MDERTVIGNVRRVLQDIAGVNVNELNEANTKAALIEPVLDALGWNIRNVHSVTREHKVVDGSFVDYALQHNGTPIMFCEAKPARIRNLDDIRWAAQIVNYANNDGVTWCALTDGIRWKVFKSNEPAELERKLAFEINICELDNPDNVTKLMCLTPDNVANGTLEQYGSRKVTERHTQRTFTDIIRHPTDTFLEIAATHAGIPAPHDPAALRRHWQAALEEQTSDNNPTEPWRAHIVGPNGCRTTNDTADTTDLTWKSMPDLVNGNIPTPAQISDICRLRASTAQHSRTQLLALIAAGAITPGETIRMRRDGHVHTATIRADGRVDIADQDGPFTLSAAAKAVTGYSKWNGWLWWTVDRDGTQVTLDCLRDQAVHGH